MKEHELEDAADSSEHSAISLLDCIPSPVRLGHEPERSRENFIFTTTNNDHLPRSIH
jgi:hypothetical protein